MAGESKDLTIEVPKECIDAWMRLKKDRRHKHLIFIINESENRLEVEKKGGRGATFKTVQKHLDRKNNRFLVMDVETKMRDGRIKETLYFVKWAPKTATVHQNVMYSTQAKHVLSCFPGVKEVGASNFDELAREIGIAEDESEEEEWDPDDM